METRAETPNWQGTVHWGWGPSEPWVTGSDRPQLPTLAALLSWGWWLCPERWFTTRQPAQQVPGIYSKWFQGTQLSERTEPYWHSLSPEPYWHGSTVPCDYTRKSCGTLRGRPALTTRSTLAPSSRPPWASCFLPHTDHHLCVPTGT